MVFDVMSFNDIGNSIYFDQFAQVGTDTVAYSTPTSGIADGGAASNTMLRTDGGENPAHGIYSRSKFYDLSGLDPFPVIAVQFQLATADSDDADLPGLVTSTNINDSGVWATGVVLYQIED
jgi:hypothetical protein